MANHLPKFLDDEGLILTDMVFVFEPSIGNGVELFDAYKAAGFHFIQCHPAGDDHNRVTADARQARQPAPDVLNRAPSPQRLPALGRFHPDREMQLRCAVGHDRPDVETQVRKTMMNRLKVMLLGAAILSGAAVPAVLHGQAVTPSKPAAPIQLDGQTLDPGIQAMLENDKVLEAAAKDKPGNDPATAAGMKAIRREVADAWSAGTAAPPEMQSVKDEVVRRGGVDVPVRIYRPKVAGTLPTIVYYHGGAWFVGGVDGSDRSSRQLAHDARAIVVSVEYRMAPENPYPASWDDAENTFEWAVGEAKRWGSAPDQVCVAGDSAGGNMAIVVTTRRLAKGQQAPLCQILYYPAVDNRPVDAMRATYNSSRLFGEGFRLDRSFTDYILPIVFPDQDLSQPEVSPLFDATRKMPPTLIATAGFDPLRDSERAYAAKLAQGGNTVIYREYPTLTHGFLQHTGLSPVAARASRETAQAAGIMAREAAAAR